MSAYVYTREQADALDDMLGRLYDVQEEYGDEVLEATVDALDDEVKMFLTDFVNSAGAVDIAGPDGLPPDEFDWNEAEVDEYLADVDEWEDEPVDEFGRTAEQAVQAAARYDEQFEDLKREHPEVAWNPERWNVALYEADGVVEVAAARYREVERDRGRLRKVTLDDGIGQLAHAVQEAPRGTAADEEYRPSISDALDDIFDTEV